MTSGWGWTAPGDKEIKKYFFIYENIRMEWDPGGNIFFRGCVDPSILVSYKNIIDIGHS